MRMRGLLIITMFISALPLRASGQVALADDLISIFYGLEDMCRGGPGDSQQTADACVVRDKVSLALKKINYCLGKEGQAGFEMGWHPCTSSSLGRSESSANIRTANRQRVPEDQQRFVDAVTAFAGRYSAAPNEMVRGGILAERNALLCKIAPARLAHDWVGEIARLDSTRGGKGILRVKLDKALIVETVTLEMQDTLHQTRTLIEPSSALFNKVASLKVGQQITFSGTFVPSATDCIVEGSLTKQGSLTEPAFLFSFSSVQPR